VLEGSVRKADNQVRINAQLIDATTGYHVWSERYDRELKDIFAVQDETVQHIVAALRTEVVEAEMARVKRIPTADLTAYDFVLRGLASFSYLTKEGNSGARQMFEKAIERDPQYAAAYAYLSATYWRGWIYQWSRDLQNVEQALTLAQKGVALDDSLPAAHSVLGQVYMLKTQFERAVAEGERAVALDPNNPQGYLWLANILGPAGRTEEAIESVKKAMRLNPRHPPMYLLSLGVAYHQAWRNEEAIATYKQYLALQPNTVVPYFGLTCSYSDLGRYEEARAAAAEILRLSPHFTTDAWRKTQWFKEPAELERHLSNLRKAGLK
jgi:adenylate cyclase